MIVTKEVVDTFFALAERTAVQINPSIQWEHLERIEADCNAGSECAVHYMFLDLIVPGISVGIEKCESDYCKEVSKIDSGIWLSKNLRLGYKKMSLSDDMCYEGYLACYAFLNELDPPFLGVEDAAGRREVTPEEAEWLGHLLFYLPNKNQASPSD